MAEAHPPELSFDDGARAVELARDAIEGYVLRGEREQPGSMRDAFYARRGAFVRIESTRGRGGLRGCAGEYGGDDRLGHAIVEAAIRAASRESCGSEVEPAELGNVTVSVCLVEDAIQTDDPEADLELGAHGIAVEGEGDAGWLYPTLPVENGWGPAEYLDRACRTVGLPPTAWADDGVTVTLLPCRVFREREPRGGIEQVRP